MDRETIISKIKRPDIDTELITRIVDRMKDVRYEAYYNPTTREYDYSVIIIVAIVTTVTVPVALRLIISESDNLR